MSKENKSNVFMGGIPTSLDVAKLEAEFGVPEKGTMIAFDELENCLRLGRDENRFRSVVAAWRKKLRKEHNLITEGVRSEGVLVLEDNRRVDHVGRMARRGSRSIKRSLVIASSTPRDGLAPEKLRMLDHQVNLLGAVINTGRRIEGKANIKLTQPKRLWGGEFEPGEEK